MLTEVFARASYLLDPLIHVFCVISLGGREVGVGSGSAFCPRWFGSCKDVLTPSACLPSDFTPEQVRPLCGQPSLLKVWRGWRRRFPHINAHDFRLPVRQLYLPSLEIFHCCLIPMSITAPSVSFSSLLKNRCPKACDWCCNVFCVAICTTSRSHVVSQEAHSVFFPTTSTFLVRFSGAS